MRAKGVEPAVRAKGIEDSDDDSRPLTYVGPAEDGSVEVKHDAAPSDSNGGSRRERREAKRQQSKGRKILRRG